ncbi:fibronectin type III domain protein, partial [Opisthorchis viverrini]
MLESERLVIAQLNILLEVLEKKKLELTNRLREARESKLCNMKGQISQITGLLTRSTGLIQFCIEMLKESDPSAFMVVSQSLIMRARDAEYHFTQELDQAVPTSDQEDSDVYQYPASPEHEVHLSKGVVRKVPNKNMRKYDRNVSETSLHGNAVEAIRQAILELRLQEDQMPSPPVFIVEECISERNVITLVWQPSSTTSIDRYTLELDDGANGNFRKVYRGPETICTVEGLHFRSVYRARVKAHNQVGEITWFHLDSTVAAPEILLTNGNRTVTSQVAEDRVIIGSTGLSRGVHYWEFTVDRCDAGGQPAFGIARQDCNKEIML